MDRIIDASVAMLAASVADVGQDGVMVARPHLHASACVDCANGNHHGYCVGQCQCLCNGRDAVVALRR